MNFRLNSLKLPNLRLYQQIIACFILVVLLPLLGVSFIIYNINQSALRKELAKFTEHTAEAIYKDLETEISWQQDQTRMLGSYLLDTYRVTHDFTGSANGIFRLSEAYEAVGIYDAKGEPIKVVYRNFAHISPELRLPITLTESGLSKASLAEALASAGTGSGQPGKSQYQVLYSSTGDPKDSPYYLRAIMPVNRPPVAFCVIQKRFDYLKELVRSKNKTLYDGVYIIDDTGMIIAGPTRTVAEKQHISEEDFSFFRTIPAGVTREFSLPAQSENGSPASEDSDEAPPLEKVFVKMPDINWGILIESPYHVRQKFVKRARNQSLLLIIACIAVVIALALFYILGINRNFRQLLKATKAMAQGNYSRRIRLISNSVTPYEIVYLAGEFNRMARKMSESWKNIQSLNQELREANEKLAKLDEFKSNLIDTVSHELRTPLTSIKGYTSRLLRYDDTLDAETRTRSLKVVKQQADRLSRLVEDLLVIPDLEACSLRVFPDQVDLRDLLERSVQFIQEKELREIRVEFADSDLGDDEPISVLADPDRLEQILLNLLDNAVKYSHPDTPISVRVSQPDAVDETEKIQVVVSNACDPITDAELETLFDKFKRLDERLTRTTRGSGLGLFITKGLVEAMGGNITLSYSDNAYHVHLGIPVYPEQSVESDEAESPSLQIAR